MYFKYKYMLPDRENKLKLILVFTRFPVVVLLVNKFPRFVYRKQFQAGSNDCTPGIVYTATMHRW